MIRIAAGKFKDQCLKILDKVAESRTSIVVTRRGRPVATIVPYSPANTATAGLAGGVLKERGDPFGTGERWDRRRFLGPLSIRRFR